MDEQHLRMVAIAFSSEAALVKDMMAMVYVWDVMEGREGETMMERRKIYAGRDSRIRRPNAAASGQAAADQQQTNRQAPNQSEQQREGTDAQRLSRVDFER